MNDEVCVLVADCVVGIFNSVILCCFSAIYLLLAILLLLFGMIM